MIETVPTFVFIRNGCEITRIDGAKPDALFDTFTNAAPTTSLQVMDEKPLNDRLEYLINKHPFMIFIKGTPNNPRCGFTIRLIKLLRENNVDFDFFDILSDNDVREGLKKYSNWPTYPQIYVKGELVGGLDIFEEMVQSGDLSLINAKQQS